MRNIILMSTLFLFTACQQNKVQTAQKASPKMVTAPVIIDEIEQCQNNEECRNELNNYFANIEKPKTESEFSDKIPEELLQEEELLTEHVSQDEIIDDKDFDHPLIINKRVQAALNEWLTWKRPKLIETWNNYQFLKNRIYPPFKEHNIPEPLLLALIAQESGGRVHSMSSAGASGLFQFMPATADRFGVKGTIGDYDARYHPETAAGGAAKYIQEQKDLYGDNYSKILAAYNSGENRFRRLNKKHKNAEIWESKFFYDLPTETQEYVSKVLSAMLIFEFPEDFNVTLTSVEGSTALIRTDRSTSLSELAVCFGQYNNEMGWYRILRNLNSSIKAKRVIKQNSVVVIPSILKDIFDNNCQSGKLMDLAQKIHQADFPDRPEYTWYKIKKGDSLGGISRRFKCTNKKEVARLNKIKAPRYLINAGKKLKIPKC